ncbi:ADP-ribosylation factor, ARF, putative [Ixodes scapularis]|uniref:ADP-ribosylation factor, ARF, putative n=1 Tax=Ixodes scapularis TaxID=6945 RepID=B7P4A7_IXOSC|nr:ADP-ribosylation factor, ARF, putative [Ixodes scapularis]|eukprot:XP_002405713.1 ADP-ribosylation factor, ARF, putative [Ixodes scapularis]
MGILFAKLWSLFSNEEHKVVIVGLNNAGKTTILYQFLMNEVVHTSPTIGSNVEEVVWKNVHFIMWDLGGQESLRTTWNTYYSNAEARRLSLSKPRLGNMTFSRVTCFFRVIEDDLTKAAVLIFANKQDIKGCMSPTEISEQLNLTSIKKNRWQIQACCALTGEGLYQGLEWVYSQLRHKK